jgi:hypothetical protein
LALPTLTPPCRNFARATAASGKSPSWFEIEEFRS